MLNIVLLCLAITLFMLRPLVYPTKYDYQNYHAIFTFGLVQLQIFAYIYTVEFG